MWIDLHLIIDTVKIVILEILQFNYIYSCDGKSECSVRNHSNLMLKNILSVLKTIEFWRIESIFSFSFCDLLKTTIYIKKTVYDGDIACYLSIAPSSGALLVRQKEL